MRCVARYWFQSVRLSVYSDYCLRVLMHAALRAPESATIDEVAEAFAISPNHLSKIVHDLALKGLLATRRGIGGTSVWHDHGGSFES